MKKLLAIIIIAALACTLAFTLTACDKNEADIAILVPNADYDHYRGITDPFLEERLICNAMLGVKLFRNRLGEISVGVNDLLDQNRTTFRRAVTGTTLRYVTNLAVGRYVAFQLTYNLRVYKRTGIPGLTAP